MNRDLMRKLLFEDKKPTRDHQGVFRQWFEECGKRLLVITAVCYSAINVPVFLIRWFVGKHPIAIQGAIAALVGMTLFYCIYGFLIDYRKWRVTKAKSLLSK